GRRPRPLGPDRPARAGGRQESRDRPFNVERAQVDEPRRNDAFDQELRRAFAAGGGAVSGPHLDAEVAAAWIEHRLDAPARRAAEAHLADCFDCQAMLATLARISPAEETASGGGVAWWRRLRAGWLVPATVAAAAALVIWVAVPQQRA